MKDDARLAKGAQDLCRIFRDHFDSLPEPERSEREKVFELELRKVAEKPV